MKVIVKSYKIPDKSIISNGFGKTDYCDSYRIVKQTNETVDKITTQIFRMPRWVIGLMKIRNSIVKILGLRTGKNENGKEAAYYPVGSKARYFTVTERNANEIVMGENDRHLYFRASVLVDREQSFIYLTTIVRFHNIWGRIYFLPVKPFHRLIIKSLLKRQVR
jgi:predicted Fe-Mo cluster-binding NifX family protein